MTRLCIILATLLLNLPALLLAVPQQINYQGSLARPDGTPLDTTVAMTFRLWPTPAGGSPDWTETHPAVGVTNGLFNVSLGSVTTLSDSFAVNRWLGISIGGDSEMIPREQIVSVAHAYRVGTVDGATGGTISSDVVIQGTVNVGTGNTVSTTFSSVTGGSNNVAGSEFTHYAHVGGGQNNTASGQLSAVSGGEQNIASGPLSFIGGGQFNQNSGNNSVLGGGGYNTIGEANSFIGGGINNIVAEQMTAIGGGNGNRAGGLWSFIGGGLDNFSYGHGSVLCGGIENLVGGSDAFLGGGESNRARGAYSVVGGGGGNIPDSNSAMGTASVVPGGQRNVAVGNLSFAAGYRAQALHHGSFVWGDSSATTVASSGEDQFVVRASGGTYLFSNPQQTEGVVLPSGSSCWQSLDPSDSCDGAGVSQAYVDSAIAEIDSVDGLFGGQILSDVTISGKLNAGANNTNSGLDAIVLGNTNDASGASSAIVGGQMNSATGIGAFVGGGQFNHARGNYSAICGGGGGTPDDSNSASGQWSFIPAGRHNRTTGAYAFAGGRNASALHTAAFVWSDNSSVGTGLSSTTNNQFSVRAEGGTRFFTNSAMTLGAQLVANATAWTTLSDSTKKTDIQRVDTKRVLDKVLQLPISEWRYKAQPDASIRHMGPMAQDFWTQFHLGEDSLGISTIDPDGIALAAIQELAKQNARLEQELALQATRYEELRAVVQSLQASDKQSENKSRKE